MCPIRRETAQPETRTIDTLRQIDAAYPRLRRAGQRPEIRAIYLLFPSSPPSEWPSAIPSRKIHFKRRPVYSCHRRFQNIPVTIRQATPRECRIDVDDLPKFRFRVESLQGRFSMLSAIALPRSPITAMCLRLRSVAGQSRWGAGSV